MSDDEFNLFAYEYEHDELKIVDFLALMDVNQIWDDDEIQLQLQRRNLYLHLGEDLYDLDCDGTLWQEVHEKLFKAWRDGAVRTMGQHTAENFLHQFGKLALCSQLKYIVEGYEKLLDE